MGVPRILLEYARTCLHHEPLDRAELDIGHDRAVASLLRHVHARSAFYRAHHAGHQTAGGGWRDLPETNKGLMMANFATFNTAGITTEEAWACARAAEACRDFTPTVRGHTIGLSSGTSGNRGLFVIDGAEKDRWTGYILAHLLPDALLARHRVAFFLRANSNLYESVGGGRVEFTYFDLSRPFDVLLHELDTLEPTVLVAPPAALALLAAEQQRGGIDLRPRTVVSVADVLEDQERARIESAFSTRVREVYQATEGLIGMSCREGVIHLNEANMVIQKKYLDDGRFTPIVTDLRRRTQPIIRYALDDVLVEHKERCRCGSIYQAIERVEGRCDDLCIVSTPSGNVPLFPDFIRRAIITASAEITDYRFTYDGARAEVTLAVRPGASEHLVAEAALVSLREVFTCRDLPVPSIATAFGIPNDPLQKRRRVRFVPRQVA